MGSRKTQPMGADGERCCERSDGPGPVRCDLAPANPVECHCAGSDEPRSEPQRRPPVDRGEQALGSQATPRTPLVMPAAMKARPMIRWAAGTVAVGSSCGGRARGCS